MTEALVNIMRADIREDDRRDRLRTTKDDDRLETPAPPVPTQTVRRDTGKLISFISLYRNDF